MDLATNLRAARTVNALSAREVARLADVSPSTVTRIEKGEWNTVSYAVVQRLLDATDLGPDLKPRSRPTAIAAARHILGDTQLPPSDLSEWVTRWRSLRLLDERDQARNPRDLAFRAGRSAPLACRPGAVNAPRTRDIIDIAKHLDTTGIQWAITGDSAANRITEYADQIWPVVYVDELATALDAIEVRPALPSERGPVMTLIPMDDFNRIGRWRDDETGMVYAAPWQVVMDSYAGTQRMPQQADRILDAWGIEP